MQGCLAGAACSIYRNRWSQKIKMVRDAICNHSRRCREGPSGFVHVLQENKSGQESDAVRSWADWIRNIRKIHRVARHIASDRLFSVVNPGIQKREKGLFQKTSRRRRHCARISGRNSKLDMIKEVYILEEGAMFDSDLTKALSLPTGMSIRVRLESSLRSAALTSQYRSDWMGSVHTPPQSSSETRKKKNGRDSFLNEFHWVNQPRFQP
jgi:hypothetical protein